MVKFGTSGWRAVMGEEFTFQNVRIVVQGIANYLKKKFSEQNISVIVNYDTRFLSERFANEAAKVLSHNRIHACLTDRDAPSQAQSYQIIRRQAQAGINFTASFNPSEYNGLKFNVESGAPALPEETDKIEDEIKRLQEESGSCPYYPKTGFIEKIDLRQEYLQFLQGKIDFNIIKTSGIRIGVDLLYGTSREYLDEILEKNHIPIEEIHGYIDPYFGGITPSCTEENLGDLKKLVRDKNCDLGLATDADGDRFGIVDEKGRFIEADLVLSILLEYLVTSKRWRGGIGRSVATTHLLDRIARKFQLPLYRTPVGFKYLADLFLKDKIIFGGEESACVVLKDHLPEKDGIMAGLLIAEMIAATGKSLSQLIKELYTEYGTRYRRHDEISLSEDMRFRLDDIVKNPPRELAGRKVINIETIDGIKLDFDDDDWMLLRFSGTIPAIRCYAEAGSRKDLDMLIQACMELMTK
jgi:phosphoglucomutase